MTPRYTDRSVSPFLMVKSPLDGKVVQNVCAWRSTYTLAENEDWYYRDERINILRRRHDVPSLPIAESIEEAEDHYLEKAFRLTLKKDHAFGHLTAFDLNSQVSESGCINRRGPSWVAMMSPEMFDRIRYFKNMGRNWHGKVTQWVFPETQETIGRWTFEAYETYRDIHVWTSPHLPQNVILTAFRDTDPNGRDGIIVADVDGGYALTTIEDPYTSIETYVTSRTYPALEP
jgi:hypothetical protein